jgi:membrane-anchored protein YejM (alkaline phosphatase superfamily)
MRKKSLFKIVAALVAGVTFWACGRQPRPENFILVTLDTLRSDYVGVYHAGGASTPRIDELAREGILFRNAYSLIPITLPAHASLFFSEPPHTVRNYNNGQKITPKRSRPSLASVFRKEGFATAAFVSLGVLTSGYGLNQGFDVYEDGFPPDRWYLSASEVNDRVLPWLEQNKDKRFFLWVHYSDPHDPYAPPSAPKDCTLYLNGAPVYETSLQKYTLNRIALNLRPGKNELRIEFRNEFDPNPDHLLGRLDLVEFSPPLQEKVLEADFRPGWFIRHSDNVYFFKGRSGITLNNPAGLKQVQLTFRGKPLLTTPEAKICYRREVEYMDGEVGKLWDKLRALGLFEKTAILAVGDHGEGLGEYRNNFGDSHVGHIHYLYGVYLKVPLIVKHASLRGKGTVRDDFVTLLDLAPTISRIMGFKPLRNFQGNDLFRTRKKEAAGFFEETYRPEAVRDRLGLLSYPWHLILTPEENRLELFNLERDPGETASLPTAHEWPPETLALKTKLESFARDVLSSKEEIQIDDKTKEMLRALGYIR